MFVNVEFNHSHRPVDVVYAVYDGFAQLFVMEWFVTSGSEVHGIAETTWLMCCETCWSWHGIHMALVLSRDG